MSTVIQNQNPKSQHALVDENGKLNLIVQEPKTTYEGLEKDYTNYAHLFFDLG